MRPILTALENGPTRDGKLWSGSLAEPHRK
jgi:hypothetical protein